MRPTLTGISGLAVLLTAAAAWAQGPYSMAAQPAPFSGPLAGAEYCPPGDPSGGVFPAGGYGDAGGPLFPSTPTPTAASYPFNQNRLEQQYQGEDGLWYYRAVPTGHAFFDFEWLLMQVKQPDANFIGSQALPGFSSHNLHDLNVHDDSSAGLRAVVGYEFADSSSLEASGFWVDEVDDSLRDTFATVAVENVPFGPSFFFIEGFELSHHTEVAGAEILYARAISAEDVDDVFRWQWLFGARYLDVDEEMFVRGIAEDIFVDFPFAITSESENDLVGGFVGGRLNVGSQDGLLLTFEAKFGGAATFAHSSVTSNELQRVLPFPPPPPQGVAHFSDDEVRPSPLVETGITAQWRIWDHVALRVGYRFLWVDGISRAGDNVAYTYPFPSLDASFDDIFVHGLTAGVDVRY